MTGIRWTVVVPVKDARLGKTRLAEHLDAATRIALVRAMAGDTLAAARAAEAVDRVVLVTGDAVVAEVARAGAGAVLTVLPEPEPEPELEPEPEPELAPGARGAGVPGAVVREGVVLAGAAGEGVRPSSVARLDAAIRSGIERARELTPGHGIAVLLGDLPALRPQDLADALHAAGSHARAFVADADGTGTTLLTSRPGVEPEPRFGPGSAHAHGLAGHVALDLSGGSSLRQDVDVLRDLGAVDRMGPGPLTRAVLDALGSLVGR